jgi:hypothetical protein
MQLTTVGAYRGPRTSANGHLQIEMDSLGTFRRYDADETVRAAVAATGSPSRPRSIFAR